MALPASIVADINKGGIRQGLVFIISDGVEGDGTTEGTFTAMSLGVQKAVNYSFEPVESDQDSAGRTWTIALTHNMTTSLMQHSAAEIEAVGSLMAPDSGTPEASGYNVLFTDGPYTEAEVLALLNATAGRTIPGVLFEGVFPKASGNINGGVEDSEIVLMFNGTTKPDAFKGFEAEPSIRFA